MTDTTNIVDDLYAAARQAKAASAPQTNGAEATAPATETTAPTAPPTTPPEDSERRLWSMERRAAILAELDKLKTTRGAITARCKELGLYPSTISLWRRQLSGAAAKPAKAKKARASRGTRKGKGDSAGPLKLSRQYKRAIDARIIATLRRALAAYELD